MALSAFKALGGYDAAIREWNAKATANKTFADFCPYIKREFMKRTKHDKVTAKSVGRGIANQAKEDENIPSTADQATWALAEVASVMQSASEKQMEKLMEMFMKSLEEMIKISPNLTPNSNPTRCNHHQNFTPCPHCSLKHKDHAGCWELEAKKDKRPANWKPAAKRKPQASS